MARKQDYDWLDDPFDDKKAAEQQKARMGTGSKVAVGLGCLALFIVLCALVVLTFLAIGSVVGVH